jgi:hypothetical protein
VDDERPDNWELAEVEPNPLCDFQFSVSAGGCGSLLKPNKEIRVHSGLRGEERLEVLIHKQIHAAGWHLDEEFVTRFAQDLARNLTKLGYKDGE